MTRRYLLHTNIISHMMLNPDGMVARRAETAMRSPDQPQLCTSIVAQCELAFGIKKRGSIRLQAALDAQLGSLVVLDLDEGVASHYARLRAHLEAIGQPLGANDTLIAAHALCIDATLVTAGAGFLRVPGLRVENWLTEKAVLIEH